LYSERADVLFRLCSFRACIKDCDAALEHGEESSAVYKLRGKSYCKMAMWEESFLDLTKGQQLSSDDATASILEFVSSRCDQLSNALAEGRLCEGNDTGYERNPRVEFHKAVVKSVTRVAARGLENLYPPPTLCYYDVDCRPGVRGHVALTIDDAPCRSRATEDSMVPRVQALLSQYGARATFFVISDYIAGHEESLVELLRNGHEVGNHCCADRSYFKENEADFQAALVKAECVLNELRKQADVAVPSRRWFRAPHGRLSKVMQRVIHRFGFQNVIGDAYANDPWISDPVFLVNHTLQQVRDGSIIIIHMPEHGFREYNLTALSGILQGLQDKGLRATTLSAMEALANSVQPLPSIAGNSQGSPSSLALPKMFAQLSRLRSRGD